MRSYDAIASVENIAWNGLSSVMYQWRVVYLRGTCSTRCTWTFADRKEGSCCPPSAGHKLPQTIGKFPGTASPKISCQRKVGGKTIEGNGRAGWLPRRPRPWKSPTKQVFPRYIIEGQNDPGRNTSA